jgi:hypothetical protein
MRLKITIGVAALCLGTALASVPVLAQGSTNDGGAVVIVPNGERVRASPNDGGTVTVSHSGSHFHARSLYNSMKPAPHQTHKTVVPTPSRN